MNFKEILSFCEEIIEPKKEQISNSALYAIYKYILDFWVNELWVKHIDEDPKNIKLMQEYELREMIDGYIFEDGMFYIDKDGNLIYGH